MNTEKMRLKVTADFIAGVADANNTMRIDVVGLNETYTANDDGRLTLCYLTNGKIYANCMGATAARETGATYTEGQKLTAELMTEITDVVMGKVEEMKVKE